MANIDDVDIGIDLSIGDANPKEVDLIGGLDGCDDSEQTPAVDLETGDNQPPNLHQYMVNDKQPQNKPQIDAAEHDPTPNDPPMNDLSKNDRHDEPLLQNDLPMDDPQKNDDLNDQNAPPIEATHVETPKSEQLIDDSEDRLQFSSVFGPSTDPSPTTEETTQFEASGNHEEDNPLANLISEAWDQKTAEDLHADSSMGQMPRLDPPDIVINGLKSGELIDIVITEPDTASYHSSEGEEETKDEEAGTQANESGSGSQAIGSNSTEEESTVKENGGEKIAQSTEPKKKKVPTATLR